MLGYDSLINYYKTMFSMVQHHKYSLEELENMIPWEKFIYIDLLKEHIKHTEELRRDQEAQMKAQLGKKR